MIEVTPSGATRVFAEIPGGGNGHVTFARGSLYATSFRGQRIFQVTMNGDVSPLAGTGAFGGQNGSALEATFLWPNGIAAGPNGDRVYVNEHLNRTPPAAEAPPAPLSRVRQITFPTLASMMVAALAEGGIDAMTRVHREWKAAPATSGQFTEVQVNQLGYQLMGQGRLDAAIAAFELNVESYPQSFNTYDSLAEAYMNDGQRERAIEFYEQSLERNPANQNAVAKLRELRGSSGGV
jgi:tetratricopeptide (TPR) repeat protein